MIESAGGMIPFICHVFLILFGGFFGLNLAFNKNFVQSNIGFPSKDAMYMGRPLGFMMTGMVLMLIATLFQIGSFTSANEVLGVLFIHRKYKRYFLPKVDLLFHHSWKMKLV